MFHSEIPIPSPLSHAYILTGGDGEGRMALAHTLAAAYLCESSPPCGKCAPCVKVGKGIHPDVITVAPAKGKREITVEQARALRADVYIRPNEGKRKVYIIDGPINQPAQNVLLKVLEDGPLYGGFLFLTGQPGLLLDTIHSRCETLTLPPKGEPSTPITPQLREWGKHLAHLLVGEDEVEAAWEAARLEQEVKGGEALSALLEAAEEELCTMLLQRKPRRVAMVLWQVKICRRDLVYNPGSGHVMGSLVTGLFPSH